VWEGQPVPVRLAKKEQSMRIDKGVLIPLGYGKYFRSDSVVGLEPIEQDRGPGKRTYVYVENFPEPFVASRSEGAILRDLTGVPKEVTRSREQYQLLSDILDTVSEINPVLRSIIRDQAHWDLDRLEERIQEIIREEEEPALRP
jgi:hypothetical protein